MLSWPGNRACCEWFCVDLFDELGLLVFVHGAMYMAFAALEQPQSIRSVGLHQPVGDCNATTLVYTPLGQVCNPYWEKERKGRVFI